MAREGVSGPHSKAVGMTKEQHIVALRRASWAQMKTEASDGSPGAFLRAADGAHRRAVRREDWQHAAAVCEVVCETAQSPEDTDEPGLPPEGISARDWRKWLRRRDLALLQVARAEEEAHEHNA